jgi:hypothetical protein
LRVGMVNGAQLSTARSRIVSHRVV